MALSIPVTWTDAHRRHTLQTAGWVGVPIDADELPERADRIQRADEVLAARPAQSRSRRRRGASRRGRGSRRRGASRRARSRALVDFLRTAWENWDAAGLASDPGQSNVVGYIFPTPGLLAGIEPHVPAALSARTGAWCFDTMTAIAKGTWEAARAAVDTALTAADVVFAGATAAYACCRPPGHHVTRSAFGGSCYLNNAAIAAQYLRERGSARVALLDIDAHHGNGAQAIFWASDDVLTASVHVDPAEGWSHTSSASPKRPARAT